MYPPQYNNNINPPQQAPAMGFRAAPSAPPYPVQYPTVTVPSYPPAVNHSPGYPPTQNQGPGYPQPQNQGLGYPPPLNRSPSPGYPVSTPGQYPQGPGYPGHQQQQQPLYPQNYPGPQQQPPQFGFR